MSFTIGKIFKNLPISFRILCGFLLVCCALAATSAVVYYDHSRTVVIDSLQDQAATLCDYVRHKFDMAYADPIRRELRLLVKSPQLEDYLMSSKEELLVHRAEVEKLFLSLAQQRDIYRSTTFLDAHGQEKVGICGNNRRRVFRSLAAGAPDDPLDRSTSALFGVLKSSPSRSRTCTPPFYDAQGRLGILVGMTVPEPETGEFGGIVVQHCDLTAFVQEVAQRRILGAAVTWIYGAHGEVLSSPPEEEPRQDPQPYLAGETGSVGSYIRTATCSLFASDAPVLTVVCSIPSQVVAQELTPIVWSVTVIFSVLLGGAVVSSFLISRWVSQPIKELTRAATNVTVQRLDLDLDVTLTGTRDEIGILANAFQKMLTDLKDSTTSIDNLNREIAERQRVEDELRRSEECLRAERDKAQAYLDVADVMLLAIDPTHRVRLVNRKACEILGYPEAEVLGKDWFETFLPEGVRDEAKTIFQQIIGAEHHAFEYYENPVLTREGKPRLIAWRNTVLRNDRGEIVATLSSGEDITERNQAEKQQMQLLQKLSGINQELKDFAYVVSHDLKAPLRAIKTLTDWLSTDYQDKLDEQGQETLRLLGGRVDRMQNLIDGVLQYSRIGRTEQGTVPVALSRLVPEIVDDLGVPAHIAIHVPPDLPTIEADATRVTQVFQNLLSNAVKYMDKPQGNITVTCVAAEGFWKFGVADNGPGIEQKNFERIFKLFQTLVRRDDCESTGVGLTVAKKIIELYGGKIWVESEVGRGSTFFFTFPQASRKGADETLQICAADV
jgi:PAS domain S-box-containing protein